MDAHVAPCGAQDRTRPAGAAGGARRSRRSCPTWPRNDGWRRPTAGTSRSSSSRTPTPAPRRCTASSTWPTPWTWRQAVAGLAAQLKELGSEDIARTSAAQPRSGSSPAPDDLTFDLTKGAPRPSRNHRAEGRSSSTSTSPSSTRRAAAPRGWSTATAGHRRSGPRLVRHRRQDHREAGAGPRGPRPRRAPTSCRTGTPNCHPSGTRPASSPGAPGPPDVATPTTPSRLHAAARRVRAISRRSVGGITGSRPTAAGPTAPSNPAPICGPSKHGYSYLRDPDGTLDVSPRPARPPD